MAGLLALLISSESVMFTCLTGVGGHPLRDTLERHTSCDLSRRLFSFTLMHRGSLVGSVVFFSLSLRLHGSSLLFL